MVTVRSGLHFGKFISSDLDIVRYEFYKIAISLKDELANDANNPIKKYSVVFAQGRGVSWEVGKTFNAQRRIDVSNVERWARENLKAWANDDALLGRHS